MTTGMLQDPIQTSPSAMGPRFRPYACPNHHVTKGRYITSNDPRGYIPVYEYPLNGQWIMMDIDDGYILWTGIWKALGNSKADIVKMIDSQPDLAPLIRRVRGGYLKIQGTWMPYEVALRLSRRVAWAIRDDLIPLFGPTFPSTCLSPDQPGYGQVVASGPGRRRARRNTQTSALLPVPREPNSNWTVVTPNPNATPVLRQPHSQISSMSMQPPPREYGQPHLYPAYSQPQARNLQIPVSMVTEGRLPSPVQSAINSMPSASSTSHDHISSHRYSPYMGPTQANRKPQQISRGPLSLDIPPIRHAEQALHFRQEVILPPVRPPTDRNNSETTFALPPVSALEDPHAAIGHDSVAVLRRLKLDDETFNSNQKPDRWNESQPSSRRHSLAAPYTNVNRKPSDGSFRFQPYQTSRSLQETSSHHSVDQASSHTRFNIDKGYYDEGSSTCEPSPISPTTPSSLSARSVGQINPIISTDFYNRDKPFMRSPNFSPHSEASDSDDNYRKSVHNSPIPHRPW